jgi:hypothetical protein
MYITNANINKSIDVCNTISKKADGRDYSQLCYDGVFMQIFQPLEPEDFALVKGKQPTRGTLPSFCNEFTGTQRGSCITESWPLFKDLFDSPQNMVKFCQMETDDQKSRCYHAFDYIMAPMMNFDLDKISPLCEGMPTGELKGSCFSDVASRLIEVDYRNIDKSVAACKKGEPYDSENICYKTLVVYANYNFHAGSKEFYEMCNAMPEPWKTQCLRKENYVIK